MKKALIIGISGQDGAYLSKFLLQKNYQIFGTTRSKSTNFFRLEYLGIKNDVKIITLSSITISEIINLINKYNPDEIYNLSAQSSVGKSYELSYETLNYNIFSVYNWLESLRLISSDIKYFHASSSEIYGNVPFAEQPITEINTFNPINPYGISKTTTQYLIRFFRNTYKINCFSGILFNHESCLRDESYVIKKIINSALNIKLGNSNKPIHLGNTSVKRDWGYAPKYVEAMWRILQSKIPDDFNICSGNLISLNDFVTTTCKSLNLDYEKYIFIDKKLYRPNEIDVIYGDNTKLKDNTNWNYDLTTENLIENLLQDEEKFLKWL